MPPAPNSSDSEELASAPQKNPPADTSESGEDGEGGEEYEIEEVLDAKRGVFPGGRIGFFVKWKGYGPEDNSWVDEQDAENARDLVDEFWRKNPHKKKMHDKKAPAKGRKSGVPDDSDAGESKAKKRGRKSTASIQVESDDEMKVDKEAPAAKKTKRDSHAARKANDGSEEPDTGVLDMSSHMHLSNWEALVDRVDTVERDSDNSLVVFFTINGGEPRRATSDVCRDRFPKKLIDFYESNLKWRDI